MKGFGVVRAEGDPRLEADYGLGYGTSDGECNTLSLQYVS
jgi:hypothetical protein